MRACKLSIDNESVYKVRYMVGECLRPDYDCHPKLLNKRLYVCFYELNSVFSSWHKL